MPSLSRPAQTLFQGAKSPLSLSISVPARLAGEVFKRRIGPLPLSPAGATVSIRPAQPRPHPGMGTAGERTPGTGPSAWERGSKRAALYFVKTKSTTELSSQAGPAGKTGGPLFPSPCWGPPSPPQHPCQEPWGAPAATLAGMGGAKGDAPGPSSCVPGFTPYPDPLPAWNKLEYKSEGNASLCLNKLLWIPPCLRSGLMMGDIFTRGQLIDSGEAAGSMEAGKISQELQASSGLPLPPTSRLQEGMGGSDKPGWT